MHHEQLLAGADNRGQKEFDGSKQMYALQYTNHCPQSLPKTQKASLRRHSLRRRVRETGTSSHAPVSQSASLSALRQSSRTVAPCISSGGPQTCPGALWSQVAAASRRVLTRLGNGCSSWKYSTKDFLSRPYKSNQRRHVPQSPSQLDAGFLHGPCTSRNQSSNLHRSLR